MFSAVCGDHTLGFYLLPTAQLVTHTRQQSQGPQKHTSGLAERSQAARRLYQKASSYGVIIGRVKYVSVPHNPRSSAGGDECSHLYVMSDPFDRSEASFGLGEQTHGELKQAGQLEVEKREQRVGRSALVCTIVSYFTR